MIKVLIIDDSFVMRKLLSDILNSDSQIEVAAAVKSGKEAITEIPRIKPDVITLDLVMPGWDGLTTLKRIMKEYPTPVIILSAHSKKDADITIECLEAGAVSFVLKPSGEMSLDIDKVKQRLIEEIKNASQVRRSSFEKLDSRSTIHESRFTNYDSRSTIHDPRFTIRASRIIVIGSSTGGPQTLAAVLSSLPPDFSVPIIIIQHMPNIFFTESLAEHLNKVTDLKVKVAENGETLEAGRVYLAPAGYQLTIEQRTTNNEQRTTNNELRTKDVIISLSKAKLGSLNPSIDITMKSVAGIYKKNAIGIILTGMGSDGADGMEAIKNLGGKTLVQDESSLIFGMPKEVIERGCADSVLPAGKIAEMIVELTT